MGAPNLQIRPWPRVNDSASRNLALAKNPRVTYTIRWLNSAECTMLSVTSLVRSCNLRVSFSGIAKPSGVTAAKHRAFYEPRLNVLSSPLMSSNPSSLVHTVIFIYSRRFPRIVDFWKWLPTHGPLAANLGTKKTMLLAINCETKSG